MDTRIVGKRFVVIGALLLCAMGMEVLATTITVTNTNDSGPGSVRQALSDANDGDTITFAVTGTIRLISGGLTIGKNVTISGPGADQLSIDGNHSYTVMGLVPGKTAAISGLTIRDGLYGIHSDHGTLTVSNCVVTGNSYIGIWNDHGASSFSNCVVSGNSSGGLYNDGLVFGSENDRAFTAVSMVIANSIVSDNPSTAAGSYPAFASMMIANSIVSDNSGPGVSNTGVLTIVNGTLSGNSAGYAYYGGGISSGTFKAPGSVTVMSSTITGNSAPGGGGGGISIQYGFLSIINSTISGNSAGDFGGGIANFAGGVQIANSTISGNSAGSGGGIYNYAGQYVATIQTGNTIFAAGASGANIFNNGGTVTSHGYNISSDNGSGYLNGPGDQINTDPMLGPLQNNGGPTFTHALLPRSPAIDAGDPNFTPPPFYDQRGQPFVRVFHGRIDIGSFEAQGRPRPTPVPRPTPH